METTLYYHPRNHNPPWMLLVLAGLLLFGLSIPGVIASTHASAHSEADMIRQCFQDGHIQQIWLNSSGERLNCLVELPDGRTGNEVIQWCKRSGWIEVTAYFLGDGSLLQAVQVLKAKACLQVYP